MARRARKAKTSEPTEEVAMFYNILRAKDEQSRIKAALSGKHQTMTKPPHKVSTGVTAGDGSVRGTRTGLGMLR